MENTLISYVKREDNLSFNKDLRNSIKSKFGIDERDFKETENGFTFLFDDETSGNIDISYSDEVKIEIKGDFAWEVIEIYRLVENLYEEE